MAARSTAIANEFLKKPGALGRLTQMHLQKLVYVAHGWKLALLNGSVLAEDPIEAWDYGPVFPELYEHTKFNGKNPLTRLIRPSDGNPFAFFSKDHVDVPYEAEISEIDRSLIDKVWNRYGGLSAFKLSDLTHKPGTPWYEAFYQRGKRSRIDDRSIQDHYRRLAETA